MFTDDQIEKIENTNCGTRDMCLLLNHWWTVSELVFNVYLVDYYTTFCKAGILKMYLDEAGCSRDLSVEVLLSLLLLDFQGKP